MNECPDVCIETAFAPDHARLFDILRETVLWDARMQARKTASFGVPYNYSQIDYPDVVMHADLIPLCAGIEVRFGFRPNNCLLNLYIDGASSVGFHFDATDRLAAGSGVAIVSLGAARTLSYRSRADRNVVRAYRLESGTLLFMPNEVQAAWTHAILPEFAAGPRISLTFRQIIE